MQLHFPSLVVGVAAAAVLLVSMSQTTPSSGPPRIEYGPNPRDMVQIKEGTPYTVPVGKLLVLTGIGVTDAQTVTVALRINAAEEVRSSGGYPNGASMAAIPVGCTASAGSVVDVIDADNSDSCARAWGYLANQ